MWGLASHSYARGKNQNFVGLLQIWYAFGSTQLTDRERTPLGACQSYVPRNNREEWASFVIRVIRTELARADFKIYSWIGVDESAGVGRREK